METQRCEKCGKLTLKNDAYYKLLEMKNKQYEDEGIKIKEFCPYCRSITTDKNIDLIINIHFVRNLKI
ncbi:MAG: Ribosomal protein L33 [Bacteriophage sp.]|nr:MAG: Ribosomal protein L33 [Bacteriophage sp.]